MISFFLRPVVSRLAVVALVAAMIGAVGWRIHKSGEQEALRRVERANAAADKRADKAERGVLTCPPELWSREHQRCATKLLP